ncbi:MAG: hypothetical protein ACLPQS_05860 [Acidimicrobiales bacterium]
MSLIDLKPDDSSADAPAVNIVTSLTGRRRRRKMLILALAVVLVAAIAVLGSLAGTYQPLQFGGGWGGTFPGLPTAKGMRTVNNFGVWPGDTYIPPQAGAFTISESVVNRGPYAVTIEAVTIAGPNSFASDQWPVRSVGAVRYYSMSGRTPSTGRSVRGLVLGPNSDVYIGLPVRFVSACTEGGFTELDQFYVQERYLIFTHWVAIPFGQPIMMKSPAMPNQSGAGIVCSHSGRS